MLNDYSTASFLGAQLKKRKCDKVLINFLSQQISYFISSKELYVPIIQRPTFFIPYNTLSVIQCSAFNHDEICNKISTTTFSYFVFITYAIICNRSRQTINQWMQTDDKLYISRILPTQQCKTALTITILERHEIFTVVSYGFVIADVEQLRFNHVLCWIIQ